MIQTRRDSGVMPKMRGGGRLVVRQGTKGRGGIASRDTNYFLGTRHTKLC